MHPRQQESPRVKASYISQLLFLWIIPLFQKGYQKTLELEDLYRILPSDESRLLGDKLEKAWNKELAKSELNNKFGKKEYKPSLTKALIKVFASSYASYGIYAFYEECIIKVAQPICLGLLLRYFNNPEKFQSYTGFMMGGAVVLLSIIYMTSDHPFTFAVQHLGMKIRVSLCSVIYRKALRMSKSALEETTSGQIVNFLSSDMNRFDVLMTFLHYIWVAPIQLLLITAVLYLYLGIGWPCITGIALIIIFVPFQGLMGRVFSKLRSETANKTDRRLMLMEEILSAMRVIKMYAWEDIFIESVEDARGAEVKALKKTAYCKAMNQSLFYVTSRITLFLTLLTYVVLGNRLTSEIVFVSLALYSNIQNSMTLYFPAAVTSLAETMIAVRRFQEFLLLDEYHKPPEILDEEEIDAKFQFERGLQPLEGDDSEVGDSNTKKPISKYRSRKVPARQVPAMTKSGTGTRFFPLNSAKIIVKNLTAQWNPASRDMAFNNISLEVNRGEILGVIGPVGAGKGSLLQAILRELPTKSGELFVRGSIGYVSQEPWIFPGSVRENVLFGKDFDSEWYDKVIGSCALIKDLSLLPYGDHTLVGDRGTALSGGQKARINLARAVYADADIYLLDDPLSAVDAEVGRHLVEKCILGLLKDKVRILVTHQLQYLSFMTEVILVIDGWTSFKGSYMNLLQSGIPFTDILTRVQNSVVSGSSLQASPKGSRLVSSNIHLRPSHQASSTTLVLENTGKNPITAGHRDVYTEEAHGKLATLRHDNIEPEEIIEELGTGSISWRLYWSYLSAGSSCIALTFLIIVAVITQILFTCSDMWLQFWIQAEANSTKLDPSASSITKELKSNRKLQIGIYTALITVLFILCLIRSINFFRMCMQTSSELHQKLFYGVIRSPMFFFESNPMGRILNRFAKDVGVIDETLPSVTFDTIEIFLQSFGVIFIVSSSSPIMLIPAFIMGLVFYFIRKFYFHTARAIKRLEGVARSPVFSHISTTLYGLPTIRAFGVEAMFQKQFEDFLDVHSSVWYLFLASSRWLGIVVDWMSILFVGSVILNFLLNKQGDAIVGLAVSSAMMLTSMLQWGIRQSAELENQMISVERVMEYCDLEPEAALESDFDSKPPYDWPTRGEIKMRNLSLQFRPDLPSLVLKNINCTIYGGEKIGVVGRTGAGKSSLLSLLFRISEPSEGFIEIDGVITSVIGLHDLRSRISIIPQEPILFLGSIRKNLDPFSEFSDLDIWAVLKDVNLDEAVKDLPQGIYATIAEGGTNFSVGQKQLFCLARAILRSNQILVLDEATANVDPETDAFIQKTLKINFADCTVITIAHRLHTVMDSDRILVLDAGRIIEFDEPDTLLADRTSTLYQLVMQTGRTEATNLLYIARMAAAKRRRDSMDQDEL